jgi:hypothetical protein
MFMKKREQTFHNFKVVLSYQCSYNMLLPKVYLFVQNVTYNVIQAKL